MSKRPLVLVSSLCFLLISPQVIATPLANSEAGHAILPNSVRTAVSKMFAVPLFNLRTRTGAQAEMRTDANLYSLIEAGDEERLRKAESILTDYLTRMALKGSAKKYKYSQVKEVFEGPVENLVNRFAGRSHMQEEIVARFEELVKKVFDAKKRGPGRSERERKSSKHHRKLEILHDLSLDQELQASEGDLVKVAVSSPAEIRIEIPVEIPVESLSSEVERSDFSFEEIDLCADLEAWEFEPEQWPGDFATEEGILKWLDTVSIDQ